MHKDAEDQAKVALTMMTAVDKHHRGKLSAAEQSILETNADLARTNDSLKRMREDSKKHKDAEDQAKVALRMTRSVDKHHQDEKKIGEKSILELTADLGKKDSEVQE